MAADAAAVAAAVQALRPLGDRVTTGTPLGPLTTYRVGGPAAVLVRVRGEDDLGPVADAVAASALPPLVIGNGSNLLVAEAGFPGIAVHLVGLDEISIDGLIVRAGGGAALPVVARRTASEGLTGFEWAVGVPGTVGGAVRMNAGGHGSDMAASLRRVCLFDLERHEATVAPADRLELGYRRSAVGPAQVVVWAELGLEAGDAEVGSARISEIVRWRREHQPGGQNAGSVFTNPPDDSAGRLVDACGLKGHRRGSAFVSEKHANFVQADDGGSADDVHALIREVQAMVEARTGVVLRPELRLIGFGEQCPPR